MVFLKTKGTKFIPDFVQIRDDNYALIAHFRLLDIEKYIPKLPIENPQKVINKIKNADYNKIYNLNND